MGVNTDEATGRHVRRNYNFTEVFEAKVANDVGALGDDLYVFLDEDEDPDVDPRLRHQDGPVFGWDKRSDNSLPASGDRCAVARGNRGGLWMISWEPS